MNELAESYTNAYNAAYASLNGQFKLFEQMEPPASKSEEEAGQAVDTMKTALDSQADYLKNYRENWESLKKDGLDKGLLEQLADGSKESAQILQDLVAGGENKIAQLNEAFRSVEQGKAAFSNTVAEMQTDFSTKMQELEKKLQDTVNTMDHSGESAEAAARTVQAYAEAAAGQVGAIEDAFAKLSAAAQIKATISLNTNGFSIANNLGGFKIPGFASGTEYAPEGWAMVGENGPELMRLSGGEKILNAQETQRAINAESAAGSGSRGEGLRMDFHNHYEISGSGNPGEIKAAIEEANQNLRQQIEDILEDVATDRYRRAYTL